MAPGSGPISTSDMAMLQQLPHVPFCAYASHIRESWRRERRHNEAWFLPVVKGVGGGKFGPPSAGVEAFVMAASTVWPSQFLGTGYEAVLATLSVLTTLLFIVGSPWAVLRGTRSLRRLSASGAAAAFLFNAHWYIRLHSPQARWLDIRHRDWVLPLVFVVCRTGSRIVRSCWAEQSC